MPLEDRWYMHNKDCRCSDCRRYRGHKGHADNFITKLFLNLVVLAIFGFIVWWGIRLFSHELSPMLGSIILIVSIAGFALLNRLRLKLKQKKPNIGITLLGVIGIFAITAFAGVEPMSAYKDNLVTSITSIAKGDYNSSKGSTTPPPVTLTENFLAGNFIQPRVISLNVVKQWVSSESRQFDFESIKPPYVVNAAIRQITSQVKSEFHVRVYAKNDRFKTSDLAITTMTIKGMGGRQAFIIESKGDYVIEVTSVGCQWWAMVGHETEPFRDN